jgi:hypothetical protein
MLIAQSTDNIFTGTFIKNHCKKGELHFTINNDDYILTFEALIEGDYIKLIPYTKDDCYLIKNLKEKYIGKIKICDLPIIYLNNIKLENIVIEKAKHYINGVLVYEGEFNYFKYSGNGTKYYPNGNIEASGIFQYGKPNHCNYFDEKGNPTRLDLYEEMDNILD